MSTGAKSWWGAFGVGIGLGWLFGLALATVASSLLTALLAALAAGSAAAVGFTYGTERITRELVASAPDQTRKDLLARLASSPLAATASAIVLSGLIIGMTIGVTAAQAAKDHYLIGTTTPSTQAAAWADATGLPKDTIARQMFAKQYGVPGAAITTPAATNVQKPAVQLP